MTDEAEVDRYFQNIQEDLDFILSAKGSYCRVLASPNTSAKKTRQFLFILWKNLYLKLYAKIWKPKCEFYMDWLWLKRLVLLAPQRSGFPIILNEGDVFPMLERCLAGFRKELVVSSYLHVQEMLSQWSYTQIIPMI